MFLVHFLGSVGVMCLCVKVSLSTAELIAVKNILSYSFCRFLWLQDHVKVIPLTPTPICKMKSRLFTHAIVCLYIEIKSMLLRNERKQKQQNLVNIFFRIRIVLKMDFIFWATTYEQTMQTRQWKFFSRETFLTSWKIIPVTLSLFRMFSFMEI